jgi:hypothetical protein
MAGYMTTPEEVGIYSRTMVNLFDELDFIGVSSMWQSFFGRIESGSVTHFSPDKNVVDIDIIRGNEQITALIPRGTVSRPLGGTQKNPEVTRFTSFNRTFPLLEDETDIDALQIQNRQAGMDANSPQTQFDNMRNLAFRGNKEMVRRATRTFEYLASQSILTGKMPAIIGTVDNDLIYDFRRNANLIFSAATPWSTTSADGFGDIDNGWRLIRQYGKVSADGAIFGRTSVKEFQALTDTKDKADNRRYNVIRTGPDTQVPRRFQHLIDSGATAYGTMFTPEGHQIWMFTYEDIYDDLTGTSTEYMPAEKVVLFHSGARCDRYFGPPEKLPMLSSDRQFYTEMFGFPSDMPAVPNIKNQGAVLRPDMFYFDAYRSNDKKKVTLRMQAAPVYATTMTDAFAVIST